MYVLCVLFHKSYWTRDCRLAGNVLTCSLIWWYGPKWLNNRVFISGRCCFWFWVQKLQAEVCSGSDCREQPWLLYVWSVLVAKGFACQRHAVCSGHCLISRDKPSISISSKCKIKKLTSVVKRNQWQFWGCHRCQVTHLHFGSLPWTAKKKAVRKIRISRLSSQMKLANALFMTPAVGFRNLWTHLVRDLAAQVIHCWTKKPQRMPRLWSVRQNMAALMVRMFLAYKTYSNQWSVISDQ